MSVNSYKELRSHWGHDIQVAVYGIDANVAIECLDCNVILLDFDNEEEEKEEDVG